MSSEETESSCLKFKSPLEGLTPKDSNAKTSEESTKLSNQRGKGYSEVALPYIEPEWSCSPPPKYVLEVIKNGTIITNVPLISPYIVFGRLETCNIALEHPSVSRYHAVLQYCPGDNTRLRGFYIYDLGSTHGTFLNKDRITSKVYYKLDVGHILKFGGSSRLYIFQGPEEDSNQEQKSEVNKSEAEVCDWGMGEDADEEEDLDVNPFALSTANEELYLDDPKKTLRGWFEREGYDLEYDVEEKGFRTFACRVQLPIDTPTGEYPYAEASVTGKKKEAVVACALEACRILDRHGLLRQAKHENRRKKRKNWEDEDFYDSDEDTYLDRTGTIEKKREIRKKIAKKAEAETFQSLTSKLESVKAEISETEKKIENCSKSLNSHSDDEKDSLESYMAQIEGVSGAVIDKVMKSKLKLDLSELYKERNRLEKLLDIARPAALPPISKNFGIIGKRPTKKFQLPTVVKTHNISKNDTDDVEVEEDSDSENEDSATKAEPIVEEVMKNNNDNSVNNSEAFDTHVKSPKESASPVIKGLHHAPIANKSPQKVVKTVQKSSLDVSKPAKSSVKVDVYKSNDDDYSMWVPPDNQTGDGTTHLNAKYGY